MANAINKLTKNVHLLSKFRIFPKVVFVVIFDYQGDPVLLGIRQAGLYRISGQFHSFINEKVGEALWRSLSKEIYEKLNPTLSYEDSAVAFMGEVENVVIAPPWITFLSDLHRKALSDSPELLRLLPTRPDDPWNRSVTHSMYRKLWGNDIVCFPVDAIDQSPRKAFLGPILKKITKLLPEIQGSVEYQSHGIVSELRELLYPLRGKFYDNYMQPTGKELATAMRVLLEETLVAIGLSRSTAIVMERCSYRALKEHDPVYWKAIFDGATIIDVLERGTGGPSEDAALLIRTVSGHRFIVTKSHFKVFAENTDIVTSLGASESFMAVAEIRNKAGKMSDEDLRQIKGILGTFSMRWMGLGGTLEPNKQEGSFMVLGTWPCTRG